LPARFHKESRYPLLILHDGNDFLRYGALDVVLDNLIERLEIGSVVAVLCNPGDRLREYGADDRHATYLATELLPAVEAEVPLVKRSEARCVVGASFGAVATLHAAWRYPGVFGRLALMSGSFAFADIGHHKRSHEFDPVASFVNAFRATPGLPAEKIYLCCGKYESLIHENRAMLPVLQRTSEVRYFESRDGHNWENWRDRMRDALSWLLPGPLWMVYE
jgi:enterochelin esterase family protein